MPKSIDMLYLIKNQINSCIKDNARRLSLYGSDYDDETLPDNLFKDVTHISSLLGVNLKSYSHFPQLNFKDFSSIRIL